MAHKVLPQGWCKPVFSDKLLQGNSISSDYCNNIVVNTSNGDKILDPQVKTWNHLVGRVDFLHGDNNERAVLATALLKKNIKNLCVKLKYLSKTITHATVKALGIQVTGMFKWHDNCVLGKAKQYAVSKKAVPCWKILGDRLFFDISSPSTSTFGGKQHWLLIMDNSISYI